LKTDRLPGVLRIAAESVELDYVKIVHTNDQCFDIKSLSTWNLFGWEERLHKKCVNKINTDIIKYNNKHDNKNNGYKYYGNFYIHNNQFVSNYYTKYIIFKCIDLQCTNNR